MIKKKLIDITPISLVKLYKEQDYISFYPTDDFWEAQIVYHDTYDGFSLLGWYSHQNPPFNAVITSGLSLTINKCPEISFFNTCLWISSQLDCIVETISLPKIVVSESDQVSSNLDCFDFDIYNGFKK